MPPKTLGDIRRQRELTQRAFATALGCNPSFVNAYIDKGKFAPNHPLIPKIAELLKLSEPEVRAFARKPEMTEGQLKLSTFHLGRPSPNKGKTWVQRRAERKAAKHANHKRAQKRPQWRKASERETSTALVTTRKAAVVRVAGEKMSKRAYNALRLMDPETRQFARSLAMTTSVAAMKGRKYLDAPIPTQGMAAILNDWFRLKGVPEQVVITIDYDKVFG